MFSCGRARSATGPLAPSGGRSGWLSAHSGHPGRSPAPTQGGGGLRQPQRRGPGVQRSGGLPATVPQAESPQGTLNVRMPPLDTDNGQRPLVSPSASQVPDVTLVHRLPSCSPGPCEPKRRRRALASSAVRCPRQQGQPCRHPQGPGSRLPQPLAHRTLKQHAGPLLRPRTGCSVPEGASPGGGSRLSPPAHGAPAHRPHRQPCGWHPTRNLQTATSWAACCPSLRPRLRDREGVWAPCSRAPWQPQSPAVGTVPPSRQQGPPHSLRQQL